MQPEYRSLDDFAAWELDAYADGEPLPHVAAFVAQQPAAWQQWQQAHQWGNALKQTLHRFDCPSPADLHAYHWQELSAAARQSVEDHVHLCVGCARELQQLQAFLDEPATSSQPVLVQPPQPDPLQRFWEQLQTLADRVQLVVATLVPTTPALAGVALRSDSTPMLQRKQSTTLLFDAGEAAISLVLQEEATGTLRLAGQLLTAVATEGGLGKLSAAHNPEVVSQSLIDDTGNFVMATLQPGTYQLVLMLPEQAIVVPNLHLA